VCCARLCRECDQSPHLKIGLGPTRHLPHVVRDRVAIHALNPEVCLSNPEPIEGAHEEFG
jgi:hypothetical protein